MATRAQIVSRLAKRRVRQHYLPNLTRAQVRTAAQGLTDAEWDTIINAVRKGNAALAGTTLQARIGLYLHNLAEQDVENALSPDDTITIQELEALL